MLHDSEMSRRVFLKRLKKMGMGAASAASLAGCTWLMDALTVGSPARAAMQSSGSRTADYWEPVKRTDKVRCNLCPRREVLRPGQVGFCRIRQNQNGRLVTLGFNRPCVLNLDPVEKNPLFNFHPGMTVLSIAHAGCNLRCLYCQNWQFAQKSPSQTHNIQEFNPQMAVRRAQLKQIEGVAFTYTEPACCPEFVTAFAELCGEFGLKRTLCTAGFIESPPFKDLLAVLDAVTITFKGPDDTFYQKVTAASLKTVLDAMLAVKSEGKWLEVATLIVPTMNDDRRSLESMATWISKNLGPDTPWLLEKFDPQYKLTGLPPTAQKTMETARQIGLDAGLKYVYIANLAPHTANHTYCPQCGSVIVKRMGFKVLAKTDRNGICATCGHQLAGVWM